MKRILGGALGALMAIILILFAISNRTPVTLGLEPLPFVLDAPLYAAVLVAFVVGFLAAGITAFVVGGRGRRTRRHAVAEAKRLREEVAALKEAARAEAEARARAQALLGTGAPMPGSAPRRLTGAL